METEVWKGMEGKTGREVVWREGDEEVEGVRLGTCSLSTIPIRSIDAKGMEGLSPEIEGLGRIDLGGVEGKEREELREEGTEGRR